MALLAPIIGIIGTAVSAYGTIAGANAQASGMEYQAAVARTKARQEEAIAQRQQMETDRKTKLTLSRAQAVASASGGSATDPTVVDNAGDIAARGKYTGGLQMWQGKMNAWDFDTKAQGLQASADATRSGGKLSAFSTILGGAASIYKTASAGGWGGGGMPTGESINKAPDDNYYWNRPYWMAS